jgi:DNA replication and repair protein RecF
MIATNGATIIEARIKSISDFEEYFREQFRRLTGSREEIRLDYQPSYNGENQTNRQLELGINQSASNPFGYAEIRENFLARLKTLRREEIRRGVTTIGPHRDEIRFFSNDIDLGVFGSRGQIRTAVMALKIAETQWLKDKSGELPVLLLDETLAELDELRRADLLNSLGLDEQAILTTTDLKLFSPDFAKTCQVWQVAEGRVEKSNSG